MSDKKIRIETVDQLITALSYIAHDKGTIADSTYETMAKQRYDDNRDIRHYMITDFATDRFWGEGDNIIEMYHLGSRLNTMALRNTDPVMAAAMIGMSTLGSKHMGETARMYMIPALSSFLPMLKADNNYIISANAEHEFTALDKIAYKFINISDTDANVDAATVDFEDVPKGMRHIIISNAMSAFFDKKALLAKEGETIPVTNAMQQFYDMALDQGSKYLSAALYGEDITLENDEQKKLFDHLNALTKGLSEAQKESLMFDFSVFNSKGIEYLVESDVTDLSPQSVDLVFESSYILRDLTAESFISKANSHELSYAETEWGEGSFDKMMEQMYRADEMKALGKADIDPCTAVYINGRSVLDLPTGNTKTIDGVEVIETYRMKFDESKPTLLDYARLKCEICAAALDGNSIDICKYVRSETDNSYALSQPVAVKVNAEEMKKEPVSLWRKILRFFGIEKSIDKQIELRNKSFERSDIHTQIKEKIDFNELSNTGSIPKSRSVDSGDAQKEHILVSK